MLIELSQQEIMDIRIALIATMKALDSESTEQSADLALSNRLEFIEKRLNNV